MLAGGNDTVQSVGDDRRITAVTVCGTGVADKGTVGVRAVQVAVAAVVEIADVQRCVNERVDGGAVSGVAQQHDSAGTLAAGGIARLTEVGGVQQHLDNDAVGVGGVAVLGLIPEQCAGLGVKIVVLAVQCDFSGAHAAVLCKIVGVAGDGLQPGEHGAVCAEVVAHAVGVGLPAGDTLAVSIEAVSLSVNGLPAGAAQSVGVEIVTAVVQNQPSHAGRTIFLKIVRALRQCQKPCHRCARFRVEVVEFIIMLAQSGLEYTGGVEAVEFSVDLGDAGTAQSVFVEVIPLVVNGLPAGHHGAVRIEIADFSAGLFQPAGVQRTVFIIVSGDI